MQKDKLYDFDIITPTRQIDNVRILYSYMDDNNPDILAYSWFIDSGEWNDYNKHPVINVPILIQNKIGIIYRGIYCGDYFSIDISPAKDIILRKCVTWKYER